MHHILLLAAIPRRSRACGLSPNCNDLELAFWTFPYDYAERPPALMRALAAGRNP